MVRAVMFDFYGTLARWDDVESSSYTSVFAAHGYELPLDVLDAYLVRYDGVEHAAHSVSEESYEAWVRSRLCDLTSACRVDPADTDTVIDALRASDAGRMTAYLDSASTLCQLRQAGMAIGVCSNWGWDLEAFLRQVGLAELIDAAVTSARAGARKPHPRIYAHSCQALGVDPRDVVFVGDSWDPDVRGPKEAGMSAVHVWRADERTGQMPPEQAAGDVRIGTLSELLDVLEVRSTGAGVHRAPYGTV